MLNSPHTLYQSILSRLSMLAADQLEDVDAYLRRLTQRDNPAPPEQSVEERAAVVMSFAGAWSDMSDEDFAEVMRAAKATGAELFNREVEL